MSVKANEKAPNLEYKNDHVHVIVHHKPRCMVEYEVQVFPSICIDSHKKAAKNIGKEVVVPGFRKGKAPPELVAKRYPHDLDRRWQEEIANRAYRESAQLANVPPVNPEATISFKMHSHSQEGAKLTLFFETAPIIPSIDPAKCVLEERNLPEITEDQVNETIRQTQMFFSNWETIENRPIQEGDFLILDVDILDETPPKKLFANTRFEVSNKSMAQWMKKLVLEKKVGDILEGMSTPDETLSEEEKQEYPPKKVQVTIKKIETVTLPELNNEFAKQVGVENISIFRKKIKELLNKKREEQIREKQREKVTEFLLSFPFDLPNSVIEKETQFRLEQMIHNPHFKNQWDKSTDSEKKDLVENVKRQAEKAVRMFYLCKKISIDQKINITPQDLPNAPTNPLESLLYPTDQHHDPRQPDIKQAEAYSRALLEKTEDWVIAHARVAPVEKKKEAPKKEGKPLEEKPKPKRKVAPKKIAKKSVKVAKKETPPKASKKK